MVFGEVMSIHSIPDPSVSPPMSSTSSSELCKGGISSLLPMSCRARAEAFARRLQSRLKSLERNGTHTTPTPPPPPSNHNWIPNRQNAIAVGGVALTKKIYHSDNDLAFLYDLQRIEPPGSPQEDVIQQCAFGEQLCRHRDTLMCCRLHSCHCSIAKASHHINGVRSSSNSIDSDSSDSVPYFDAISDTELDKSTECNDSTECASNSIPQCTYSAEYRPINGFKTTVPHIVLTPSISGGVKLEVPNDSTHASKPISTISNGSPVVAELKPEIHKTQELSTNDTLNTYNVNDALSPEIDKESSAPPARRCSSLKTGKTPPDTPGRKKIVRFIDILGVDIADVRTFLDEIPNIPTSAYQDLSNALSNCLIDKGTKKSTALDEAKLVVALFPQPCYAATFADRVRDQYVCLESAQLRDPVVLAISGSVRVRNLDFHKSVHIRYTMDGWRTHRDVQATYTDNSCDGFSDQFTFVIYAHELIVGQRMEFAVRYQCKGSQFWDNNNGANYCFQCLPSTSNISYASTANNDGWADSFY